MQVKSATRALYDMNELSRVPVWQHYYCVCRDGANNFFLSFKRTYSSCGLVQQFKKKKTFDFLSLVSFIVILLLELVQYLA